MKKQTLILRRLVQFFFFALLIFLWLSNQMKLWMAVILLSFLLTPFLGRVFCGWGCPIFTTLRWTKPLFKNEQKKIWDFKKWTALGILISFIAIFVLFNRLNFPVPVFVLLIPTALFITFFVGEVNWHRICPLGIVYSFLAQRTKAGYYFIAAECSDCMVCKKVCPSGAIMLQEEKAVISREHCLLCGKCAEECPLHNIRYGR